MRGPLLVLVLLIGARAKSSSLRHHAAARAGNLEAGDDAVSGTLPGPHAAADGVKYTTDVTSREGLGENLPYPSVDYLGVGYDIFRGNPEGDDDTQLDPGFRNSVIQLMWDQGNDHLSRDMRYLQPVGGFAFPAYSCHQTSSCRELSSSSDYQHSLSVDASVEGEYNGVVASGSFSASAGYASFSQDVEEKQSERFEMVSYCIQFKAGFDKGADTELVPTAHFARAVAKLPKTAETEEDQEAWINFFTEFGTHYISTLDLGGKMMYQMTIERSSVERMRSSSVDVSAAVAASFGAASGKASVSTSSSKESAEALSSANTDTKTMVLGGLPPASGGSDEASFGDWAASVRDAPMPVKYKLTELAELSGVHRATYHAMLAKYKTTAVTARAKEEASTPHKPKAALHPGQVLAAGGKLVSSSKKATLELTEDGAIVVADAHGNRLWSSETSAGEGAKLEYTTKGNLVLSDDSDRHIWQSHTGIKDCGGKPPGSATLMPNGNFAIKSGTGDMLWSTGTGGMTRSDAGAHGRHEDGCSPAASDSLKPGESLRQKQRLTSTDGGSYIELTTHGELNLYAAGDRVWHSHFRRKSGGPYVLKYQEDGNLVVYDASKTAVWEAKTTKGDVCNNDPGMAKMTDDGNFIVYGSHGEEIWSTDTSTGVFGSNMDDPEGDFESGCDD